MKGNLKQRILAIALCVAMLVTSVNLTNLFENDINAVDILTVDLTNASSDGSLEHEHIYVDGYNKTQHYQECTICGNKTAVNNHNYEISHVGGTNCNGNNYDIYVCDCGYSYKNNPVAHTPNPWETSPNRYLHYKTCKVCGRWADNSNCVDSNGKAITCTNLGTCKICNYTYTEAVHKILNGKCEYCKTKFYDESVKVTYNSDYTQATVTVTLSNPSNGAVLSTTCTNEYFWSDGYGNKKGAGSFSSSNGKYMYSCVFDISNLSSSGSTCIQTNSLVSINGIAVYAQSAHQSMYSDHIKPTTPSIKLTDLQSVDGWSTKKQFNITGSDSGNASYVKIKVTDENNNVILNSVTANKDSSGKYSYTSEPLIEAAANGSKFTVIVTDELGNATTTTFTCSKTDTSAPELVSTSAYNDVWAKSKTATFSTTDYGVGSTGSVGNVLIGLNKTSDIQSANYDSSSKQYYRTYVLTGDVYEEITCLLYVKDALGNSNTIPIKVNKLDSTKPTITGVSSKTGTGSSTVTITANDKHSTLGEGSGVSQYGLSTSSSTQPTSWNTSNTITVSTPGTYYAWVKDAVGNISATKSVKVSMNIPYSASDYTGTYDGKAHGITVSTTLSGATIKYGTTEGTYDLTTNPTYTNAGTYTVYYQIAVSGYNTVTGSQTVKINKANGSGSITMAGWTFGNTEASPVVSSSTNGTSNVTYQYKVKGAADSTYTTTKPTTPGTYTVKATFAATTNYNAVTATTDFTITKGTINVTASGYTGTYDGKAHSITISSNPSATITYSTDGTNYSSTKPTFTDAGTYTVYYKVTKDNYNTVTGSKQVIINKAENTLTLSSTSGSVKYPETKTSTFTITQNVGGGELSVKSSNTGVATVDINGTTVTMTNAKGKGSTTITVTSAETKNYLSATATYTLNVSYSNVDVTYIDVVDSIDGKELDRQVLSKTYASTVKGSDLGSSTKDNEYHNGYYYVEDTSATVVESGTVVYRIFKLATTDVNGTITWKDKSNAYKSRPDSIIITIKKDGEFLDSQVHSTTDDKLSYSFTELQKYDTETGEEFDYQVYLNAVYSKNPEERYNKTQNGTDFILTLVNYSSGNDIGTDVDTDGDGKPDINIDTDGDGIPDVNIDTDGDEIPDVNIDTDGDNVPDVNIDTDGDNVPDIDIDVNGDGEPDVNVDTDGDGIADDNLTNQDTDGDGKPDINVDTDGDGIPDTNIDVDGNGKPDINVDTDGDNIPDIDIDVNGDGEPDVNIDTDGDGIADDNLTNQDTDGDGKPDVNVDTDKDGKPDVNVDTDGDGKPDVNVDINGDGKPDVNVDTNRDGKPDVNVDTDKDGKPDVNVDTDGDGKPDVNVDTNKDGEPDINVDTDGDGKPDVNIDTDGDRKPDVNVDTDKDGIADDNLLNQDTDGDGKPDINVDTDGDGKPDVNIDVNGDEIPDVNVDTDKDGKPDVNVDTDKDGKPDVNVDTNGDGKPDVNVDIDGDNKPDVNVDIDGDRNPDVNVDTNGDGKPDTNIDIDKDNKPDVNIDTDGDGIADDNLTNQDTDGDGKPDINVDTDGDGMPDTNIDIDGNGKPDVNVDTDKDGKPDVNVDTDKDGEPDVNVDTDKDGKPDVNVDTDKDGKPDVNVDTDKDGKPDVNVDTDKDGKPDVNVDTDKDGKPDVNVDTDKDGKPDVNVDTDGDNIPDYNVDTDNDGEPDKNIVNKDTDGDGKPDINVDTDEDGIPDVDLDTNGDDVPDVNIDTDKDGKPDINIDTDKDGKPDVNVDTDGDNVPDTNVDTNNDGKPDINIDINGDGEPDVNVDTDGDGKPDKNIINQDTDGDGKADVNVDTDGDGIPDVNVDTNGDGKPDVNIDTDGDNKPDVNIDTDGDGDSDVNIDTDGDGKPDKNIDDNNNGIADDEEDNNPYGPNPENEEVGYTISGNIIWKDNNNKLGYRPEKIKIILYQNGKEFASGYVNMTKYATYQFTGLPKYDSNMNPYTYTVKQEFTSTYLTWDSSAKKYVTADAYSTTKDGYDFINTFITPNEPVIEVKPDHVNTLFLKLSFNESIDWDMIKSAKEKESVTIQFKELMKSYDANGNVSYSSDYSGMTYNTFLTSKGCTISGIPSGKYEIIVSDSSVLNLDNIKLGNSSNMSIVKESGNYYLIINDSNTNNSGIVTFNYNADGFFGYSIINKLYNLFKMN